MTNSAAATLASANAHSDAGDVTTLNSANTHADIGDATTLASAETYADTGDAATLASANAHADAGEALDVRLDGSRSMTGALDLGSNQITSLAAPALGPDATNKTYVDAGDAASVVASQLYTPADDANWPAPLPHKSNPRSISSRSKPVA